MTVLGRVRGVALLGLALAAAGAGCGAQAKTGPVTTTPPRVSPNALLGHRPLVRAAAPAFRLSDQNGSELGIRSQRGHVVLLAFLYTRCRDVCPVIASNLNTVLHALGRERSHVRVLAVSVDPEHDTPRAVRAFVRRHALLPQFHYLTGPSGRLRLVWQAYNVLALQRNLETIDHSAPTILIDERGVIRAYYDTSFRYTTVLHDVRVLLR